MLVSSRLFGIVDLRKIDVGWVITAGGGRGGDNGDAADCEMTGRNDVCDRRDDVDAFGDNGFS